MKYTIDTGFGGGVGESRIIVEGEAGTAGEVRAIASDLLGLDKPQPGPAALAAQTEPSGPVSFLSLAVPATNAAAPVGNIQFVQPPTVEDVNDAVKLVVGKLGVPRAAALLKEFGGARSDLLPAENRMPFIVKAQEVSA